MDVIQLGPWREEILKNLNDLLAEIKKRDKTEDYKRFAPQLE
jgi:hypothetical protein